MQFGFNSKKLEEQPGATGTMRLIGSKFPRHTREKIGELRKRDDHWTVEELLFALDKVIDPFEIMEDTDLHITLATSTVHSVSHCDSRRMDNRSYRHIKAGNRSRHSSHQQRYRIALPIPCPTGS